MIVTVVGDDCDADVKSDVRNDVRRVKIVGRKEGRKGKRSQVTSSREERVRGRRN